MSSFEGDVLRWSGSYFGWIDDQNHLFTLDGREIARVLFNRQVYGKDGQYLGELRFPPADLEEGPRLITKTESIGKRELGFQANRLKTLPPIVKPADGAPLEYPDGYEDFPDPDSLYR